MMNDEFRFTMRFSIQSHSPEDFQVAFQVSNLIPCRSPAMQFVPKDCAEALHLRCIFHPNAEQNPGRVSKNTVVEDALKEALEFTKIALQHLTI